MKETLEAQREALSGVSLDEEAINLMRQQRAFQGAARVVAAVDEMMQTMLDRDDATGDERLDRHERPWRSFPSNSPASATCCGPTSRSSRSRARSAQLLGRAERAVDRQAAQRAQRRPRATPRSCSSCRRRSSSARRTRQPRAGGEPPRRGRLDARRPDRPAPARRRRSRRPTSAPTSRPTSAPAPPRVVESIYNQALSLANQQFEGVYLFGGDRATDAPFVDEARRREVRRLDATCCTNTFDENTDLPFMVDGGRGVRRALDARRRARPTSRRVVSAATRLRRPRRRRRRRRAARVDPAQQRHDHADVDLSRADTIGDVINAINAAGVGGDHRVDRRRTASASSSAAAPADNITVTEVGGGTTAADLGILHAAGAGAGRAGRRRQRAAAVTPLTPLATCAAARASTSPAVDDHQRPSSTATHRPRRRATTRARTCSTRSTARAPASAREINAAGTGIDILNPTQGTQMTIAENGGTTAADLGVRSFDADVAAGRAERRQGRAHGRRRRTSASRDSDGTSFDVDVDRRCTTVQDVIDAINTADARRRASPPASRRPATASS